VISPIKDKELSLLSEFSKDSKEETKEISPTTLSED
jgi:hypothetical protein